MCINNVVVLLEMVQILSFFLLLEFIMKTQLNNLKPQNCGEERHIIIAGRAITMKLAKTLVITTALTFSSIPALYAACADNIDMGNQKILNLGAPTGDSDAATKQYVDDNIVTGGWVGTAATQLNMNGNSIDMNNQRILNLQGPVSNSDAATKQYVDDNIVTGGWVGTATSQLNMNGNTIHMGGRRITNLGDPVSAGDAVNRGYVDATTTTASTLTWSLGWSQHDGTPVYIVKSGGLGCIGGNFDDENNNNFQLY
jgi:hypothetical protein